MMSSSNEYVLFEKKDKVGLVTLSRPKALNALCDDLITQLNTTLFKID